MKNNQYNNKRNEEGKGTEKFIAKTFKNAGYWVYNMPKKIEGQPCDLVAVKGGKDTNAWLIDAKHVEEGKVSFSFDRIEPNQLAAMSYAIGFAKIQNVGFAIFFDRNKTLYWFPYNDFLKCNNLGMKSINMHDLQPLGELLNEDNNK